MQQVRKSAGSLAQYLIEIREAFYLWGMSWQSLALLDPGIITTWRKLYMDH